MHYSHKLEKRKHKGFLNEKRNDPITGERIEAGHKIVICSACKSAFFEESWQYLGGKHCNQTKTLSKIPIAESIQIKFKELDFEFSDTELLKPKEQMIVSVISFVFVAFSLLTPMVIVGGFLYLLSFFITENNYFTPILLCTLSCLTVLFILYQLFNNLHIKLMSKSPRYRKFRRLAISQEELKYRLIIDEKYQVLSIRNQEESFVIPLQNIVKIDYFFYSIKKNQNEKEVFQLKATFDFINNEEFNQKTLITEIAKIELNQWKYFINKLPSHIETKIISQRI
ncbi:hypothetical protein ACE193_16735 [Bernardetia sp. OM2101]|uniref:hypothetical protein n=1 Tax=Bernardetia sp. OM2101 TaxID=3344876 RepID=UPI0035CF39FB